MESLPMHLAKHIKVCLKEIEKMGRGKIYDSDGHLL